MFDQLGRISILDPTPVKVALGRPPIGEVGYIPRLVLVSALGTTHFPVAALTITGDREPNGL